MWCALASPGEKLSAKLTDVESGQKCTDTKSVSGLLKGKFMERNAKLTGNARSLRKQMTKEENKLWYQFLRLYRPRFHRQYVIGNFIADFYCHGAKLVVELDGSQHCTPEEKEYDQKRTEFMQSQGLKVLRFSNLDVMRRFQNVCEAIDMAAKQECTSE